MEDLSGKSVVYRTHPEAEPEDGVVVRMAETRTKLPACFVKFSNAADAKLCYIKDLEVKE